MENDSLVSINGGSVPTLELFFLLTIIALLPSIVIMMTSFTRIIIVLSFARNAIGVQNTPPNMVLTGIALFLTLFIMNPVISQINTEAFQPYREGKITQEEALRRAQIPLKQFMLRQTEVSSLEMYEDLAGIDPPQEVEELPMTVVIPAFMTSELKRGFLAGFLIYLPFLLIDVIVSSTLLSMGMMMLPPATIALPFKLLLFVTVDGWGILFRSLAESFH